MRPAAETVSLKIEMHFLPDVYVPCEVCGGKRYNRETLEVKYKGKSIYDVLNMTVEEALPFFEHVPSIRRKIQTLYDVGLSYIQSGTAFHGAFRRRGPADQAGHGAVAEGAPARPSISWMSPRRDFILQMCIS